MAVPDERQFEPELGGARGVAADQPANGPVAGQSPLVATAPTTWQYCGTVNVPAGSVTVEGGTTVADVTVTLGTLSVAATQDGAAPEGAKPAHWPCRAALTKSGPKLFVGGGVFPVHCRFPA